MPASGLTTFPNPFQDDPEPGLLPSILSKVKSTFSSAPPPAAALTVPSGGKADKASVEVPGVPPAQTEAQQIAEAAKKQAQEKAHQAAQHAQHSQHGSQGPSKPPSEMTTSSGLGPSKRGSELSSQLSIAMPSRGDPSTSSRPSPTTPGAVSLPVPSGSHRASQQSSGQASASSSQTPSINSQISNTLQSRRTLVPGKQNWRPSTAAPAQVTVSPVTSVTTTMPSKPTVTEESMGPPPAPRLTSHTAIPSIDISHARGKSIGPSALGGGRRPRRGSISTIPDSPSSVSLSAMVAANAELSQPNFSFVPGFQLPAEDTRSVRSLGFVKRPGSVSKIIRRMRGEGLSKHYWMADEHCKECYDCKSVFTTWRRKHHCRICGQIFCGRCASNIIGARRFGQDGMVRVCNLCLKIMEEYDDDDDRRSISSAMSNLPDRVISPEMAYTASPYAASQLFTRQHNNDSLTAIDESSVPRYWNRNAPDLPERPFTPEDTSDMSDSEDGHVFGMARPTTAPPFRRMGDDNSDEQPQSIAPSETPSPRPGTAEGTISRNKRLEFPTEGPHVSFPSSEYHDSDDGRTPAATPLTPGLFDQFPLDSRTRLLSTASLGGGLNALLDTDRKDGLWRARSLSFAGGSREFISGPSLDHFNTMLQQAIDRNKLTHRAEWHRTLNHLLLRVSDNLCPMVRAGDSIDIRTYVKIKKVPGGKIRDSEYVDGIVITKNVAHKGMSRRLVNPRIMVITFPLDYHRVETQFMSLDPIMKQERDYLRLLTNRIIDLRPHIVLVERFVSRIALEFLYQANIVVARGVKFSAIHQVARCTHADIIGSMDRLALEPRLGRCADFKVQTFEDKLIPGRRKTYMRFEGTHNGFGGTIILRGGPMKTLSKVKDISDFMALVAYHLKNEIFLYGDEFHILPPSPPLPDEYKELLRMLADPNATPNVVYGVASKVVDGDGESTPRQQDIEDDKEQERQDAMRLTRQIAESLEPYLTTVLSASVAVRFPPPAPLAKMAALDRTLNQLRLRRDEKEAEKILEEEKRVPAIPVPLASEAVKPEVLAAKIAESKSTPDLTVTADSPEGDGVETPTNESHKLSSAAATSASTPNLQTVVAEAAGGSSNGPSTTATSGASTAAPASPHLSHAQVQAISTNSSSSTPPTLTPALSLNTTTAVPPGPTPTPVLSPSGLQPSIIPGITQSVPSSMLLLPPPNKEKATSDPYRVLLNPDDFKEASDLAFIELDHSEQVKLWQHYVRRNPGPLAPKNFQGIVYLQSLYRQGQDKPCVETNRQQINFYQEDDQTLGQLLGSMVSNAAHRCPNKTCEQLMLFHYDVLVHAERRLQIVMEQFMCPLVGHEEQIVTWTYCRECNRSWEPTVMREETWRMSWGAYLEHCFYPPKTRTGFGCQHDAYREHIRYFAHHNMVVRIHNDDIELYEPVRPSIKLMVRIEDKVILKNQEYESALAKTAAFFDSVLFRLRSFSDDLVDPDKITSMRADRDALLTRAVADRDEMVNSLNRTYKQTPPTDVLAINVVLQALQDKVIQWDVDFLDVEKLYMPTEKDLRRMTATHLKRLFATQDVFGSLDKNIASISVPEEGEGEKATDGETSKVPSPASSVAPQVDTPLEIPQCSLDSPLALDEPRRNLDVAGPPPVSKTTTISSESVTPTPTLSRAGNKLPILETPPEPRNYDSDSTISAFPRGSVPNVTPMADRFEASSGVDSDAHVHGFVSRLPRKARPAPSIADLVKRFQDSVGDQEFDPMPIDTPPSSIQRPRSAAGITRRVVPEPDVSDSDVPAALPPARPKFHRRGRHDNPGRQRDASRPLLSDADRSYAVNAARVVSSAGKSRSQTAPEASTPRGHISRTASPVGLTRSRATSPSGPRRDFLLAPSPRLTVHKTVSHEGKPRIAGKGRTPRKASEPLPSGATSSPGGSLLRGVPRRVVAAGSRVTSIARHFDKITREAERDRQKRLSLARGKRAGRVGVTKAKVQVFNNVRDAFKDEFDSDSSAADNEEDEDANSDVSVDSTGRAKPRRKPSSPSKPRPALPKPLEEATPTKPEAVDVPEDATPKKSDDAEPEAGPSNSTPPNQTTESQLVAPEHKHETTRHKPLMHIELGSFDTAAPLPSIPPTPQPQVPTEDEGGGKSKNLSAVSQMSESEMSTGGGERSSILKTLTGLWAFRAGDFTPLEYPLSAAEHIFVDSRVIVRENEPTSIIAFTLSSKTYRDQMRSVAAAAKARRHEPSMLDEITTNASDRPWDIISVDEAMETDDPRRAEGTHSKYDFESGSSTISCRIFFAEQFAALRQACQCEDSFVESLARCAKFDASGGKSGSAFLKTKDDRFIVKEISRLEMDAITKFAPAYFEYTSTAFQRGRPTALAKTYGIFKIGYRNAVTGRSMHMNVLVQENLFYNRTFSKIYDLKGSTRNRLIKPTGKVNEVLLDENLMEVTNTSPLYLRDHSKRILRTALWNDTLFLSNLNVMDYSLVVGVDTEHHELVVGVVDYIRTFTWDKKVESWVKDFGGGGRGEPTIVTPLQYRKRFRTAMERYYFPSVPDRWPVAGETETPAEEDGATLMTM